MSVGQVLNAPTY